MMKGLNGFGWSLWIGFCSLSRLIEEKSKFIVFTENMNLQTIFLYVISTHLGPFLPPFPLLLFLSIYKCCCTLGISLHNFLCLGLPHLMVTVCTFKRFDNLSWWFFITATTYYRIATFWNKFLQFHWQINPPKILTEPALIEWRRKVSWAKIQIVITVACSSEVLNNIQFFCRLQKHFIVINSTTSLMAWKVCLPIHGFDISDRKWLKNYCMPKTLRLEKYW